MSKRRVIPRLPIQRLRPRRISRQVNLSIRTGPTDDDDDDDDDQSDDDEDLNVKENDDADGNEDEELEGLESER